MRSSSFVFGLNGSNEGGCSNRRQKKPNCAVQSRDWDSSCDSDSSLWSPDPSLSPDPHSELMRPVPGQNLSDTVEQVCFVCPLSPRLPDQENTI